MRLGDREAYWQDWPAEYRGSGITCYYEPSEADIAARPYLLTTVSVQFTVPPAASATRLEAGRQAVDVVLAELNRVVGPVLGAVCGRPSPAEERAG